jgi:precorrin-3B C17-methyltransferase
MERRYSSNLQGKLYVVGIGPGAPRDLTRRAEEAITGSTVVVGYTGYLKLIEYLTKGKEKITSGMTREVERCTVALEQAAGGKTVALVSSGDAGVYGMAGLALEIAAERGIRVSIEIVPGVTSATAAAAKLGAPLMLDFAVISLSDILVPWENIEKRISSAAAADFVVVLYNPRSSKRKQHLEKAVRIILDQRPGSTPVGIATAVGRGEEKIILTDLNHLLDYEINMQSTVIIGNLSSKALGEWFITPRGYRR